MMSSLGRILLPLLATSGVTGALLAAEVLLGALPEHPWMETELREQRDESGFGLSDRSFKA